MKNGYHKGREFVAINKGYIAFGILLLFFVIWFVWVAPALKKLPANFSYTADILSLDNFYDANVKKFEGAHISKTLFVYRIVSATKKNYLIENYFNVSKLSGKPIITLKRIYSINPYTTKQLALDGKKRFGYLFGPRYADKSPFYYWHVNYDAPAHLHFIKREFIEGLNVYHYRAQFQADQTANLAYLPNVPETQGIKTDVMLDLWIEPISGWLVKYEDHTLAYYYDRHSGKKLFPWNQFSNRYTINSIQKQVSTATYFKWKILLIDFLIPFFLTLIVIFILNYYSIKTRIFLPGKRLIHYYFSYIFLVILIILLFFSIYYIFVTRQKLTVYTIGISHWSNNPDLLAAVRGFKDGLADNGFQEGKNIKYYVENPKGTLENQIRIIQKFLREKVNLLFTLTTPGALIAKGITTDTPIIFADVSYPLESNLISALKYSTNNLVGTRNYIATARQFFHFEQLFPNTTILGFVHRKGDPDSEIQLQEFKNMLNKRNIHIVDIAAIDTEHLSQLLQKISNFNALYIACDTLTHNGGNEIVINHSLKYKIPTFSCEKNNIIHGALVGYVADAYLMGKQAGYKAALILQGADPSWLSTDVPEKGVYIINLQTANELGIPISPETLHKADILVWTKKP